MKFSRRLLSYFPTPYFLDMAHVGLDITPSSIKFIELTKAPGHLKISKYGSEVLPTPLVFDSSLVGNKDLENALVHIQKSQKISFVEVSIPEVKSYLYTTEIPAGDDASMRSNIEMHLEENVPLTLSEAIFEYFPIRTDKRTGQVTVAVSVVPYQIVHDYTVLLEKAGMTPISFLIENQALSRAVINYDDEEACVLVQISEKRTVLSIVADHAVQFTSSVPIGSADFTDSLVREYKITKEEAEKMKVDPQYEGMNLGDNKLFEAIVSGLSDIKDETQKALVYWQSFQEKLKSSGEVPGSMIKKIILSGRDALLPGIKEYLSESLNMEVEVANVWQNVLNLNKTVPDITYNDSLDYATAIGLALPKHRY